MAFIVSAVVAVVNFVVSVVTPVVAFVKANIGVVAAVAAFAIQPFLGNLFGIPDMPSGASEAERQQGVLVTSYGSVQNIPVVYGYRKVGGKITFAETGSTDNKYLWVAYVLSEGPIEGLRELFIDDHQLPSNIVADLNLGRTVNITEGKYANRVQLQFAHGIYFNNPRNSTVGTWSILKDSPSWKTSMVYNGLAVVFARYEWKKIETQEDADNNPFGGSIPNLQATILGRKVASISNASSNDYANRTERYSTNPAEILCDYLSNPRYGKGLVRSDFDWPSWEIAKNKCNQRVEYVNGIYGPILTTNYVLDTGQTIFNNTKILLAGFRAYMPFTQGLYKLKIEDAGNPTDILSGSAVIERTFNVDNIVGAITYTGIERSAKYNAVRVGYVDPDNKWSNQEVVFPETESSRQFYITEDGGRENVLDVFFPTITNYAIAKDMARLLFGKSRLQETCSFTATSEAIDLEVGDNIYIQSKMLNFSTIPWRIVSININNDMTVELGCVRNPDGIYPHTRYGEIDIVQPVYVPRGATIYYPAVQTTIPIGLVPPTNATTPVIFAPPRIQGVNPSYFNSPGSNTLSVFGTGFQSGINAAFIGEDGTVYTPSSVTRISDGQIQMVTLPTMTAANQPYDIVVQNSAAFGSLSSRFNNCLNVDGTLPPSVTDPITNPPTVDPPITEQPDDPTITPPPSDPPDTGEPGTNPPDTEPVLLPLTDFVAIDNISLRFEGDLSYATLTFKQPLNPMYNKIFGYYKRQAPGEVYTSFEVTTRPGPGQNISFEIGPLITNTFYTVITRVYYDSGEASSQVNRIQFHASDAGVGDPRDYPEQASTGWPLDPGEAIVRRDNQINNFSGITLTTTGVPRDPRQIQVTLNQNLRNEAANWDVIGVKVYYKPSQDAKWAEFEHIFGDNYVPGVDQTFTIGENGELGFPVYPDVPIAAQQNYDFIFRFLYIDRSESSNQLRIMQVPVEWFTGLYTFNPFSVRQNIQERTIDYTVELIDPSAPSAASSMTVNITGIGSWTARGTEEQRFYITPPDNSVIGDWAGMKFRSRPVVAGADPEYDTHIDTNIRVSPTAGNAFYIVPTVFEQDREWVVTPLYRDGLERKESSESWFGVGYVANRSTGTDVPTVLLGDNTVNWYSKFNWRRMKTADAVNTIDSPFPAPANPRVQIVKFNSVARYSPTQSFWSDHWLELEFDHRSVPGYVGLDIYRRTRNQAQVDNTITRQLGNYIGLGRWEKVAFNTVNTSGTISVNLRAAEDYTRYNINFNPSLPVSSTNQLLNSFVNPSHFIVSNNTTYTEILLVARTTSGTSDIGVLLPIPGTTFIPGTKNILNGVRPTEVFLSNYEGINTILGRNLSQAVTAPAQSELKIGTRGTAWPIPSGITLI